MLELATLESGALELIAPRMSFASISSSLLSETVTSLSGDGLRALVLIYSSTIGAGFLAEVLEGDSSLGALLLRLASFSCRS